MKFPRHWYKLGLTQRIISYVLPVAAIPVVLIALFSFRAGSEGIRTHTAAHLTSVVIVKAQEVERWTRPFEATAQVLSIDPQIQSDISTLLKGEMGADDAGARASLEGRLSEVMENRIGLRGVAVVSVDSAMVLAFTGEASSLDKMNIPSNIGMSDTIRFYLPPYNPADVTTDAIVVAPVMQDERVLACLVLFTSALPLYEALSPDTGLGVDSKVYIVNRSGEALTPPQLLPEEINGTLTSGIVREASGSPVQGSEYADFLGVDVIGSYQPVSGMNWGVVAELPTSVAFRDIDRMRWAIAGASGIFFLLIVASATLVSRRITGPVKELASGARAIGSGDLSHNIRVSSSDELGLLARSFNQMASDLAATQQRMVEAERAAALQAFTEQKVDQLKQLSRLGLLIATESSLGGLLDKTPELARGTTRADLAGVIVFSEGEETIEYFGHTESDRPEPVKRLLEDRQFLYLLAEGRNINHSLEEAGDKGRCRARLCIPIFHEFNSILATPLNAEGGNVAGAIILVNQTQQAGFSQEDQELLQIVAGYVSATLQKIRKENSLQDSERRALEAYGQLQDTQEQLVQAQKMESIGRLAGGVAHDFNNLLTPIIGYAQLGLRALPDGDERLHTNLLEIQDAAERASNLTRQLLAFSRKQVLEPKIINVGELILNMDKMLRRLIGEDIELITIPGPELSTIKADPGQIEQVIMNLVINARDAMPGGGKLIIETDDVTLDDEYARLHPPVEPGRHVLIAVSDNGLGIPENVLSHIFEPFFTTKGEGKGTGLGLATCYGIVQQNGGHISVYSEPGKGTTFRIYLPAVYGEVTTQFARAYAEAIPAGSEKVLLVEDEILVRELATRVLQEQGYTVLEASNGEEALKLLEDHNDERIDLLLTDVIMPVMGGRELAERIREARPNIKVLYMSGYTDDAIIRHGVLPAGTAFAEKPFSPTVLATKVRQILDDQPVLG